MTNAPNSGNDPGTSRSNRRLRMILVRTSIALGVTTLVSIVGGAWFAWIFVHQRLAPIVQADLTKTLKRPVQLGKVESFWITSLRFGSSSLPPTPTDPDTATVAAVEVGFNPLQLLLTRTLKLDITLVKPNLYLEQDKQGRWITISVEPKPEEGGFKTEVETVRVQNADAVLVPFPKLGNQKLPIKFAQIDGGAQLSEEGKRVRFQLAGQALSGGNFKVEGDSHLTTPQETRLSLQGQNLVAADISRLLKLPSLELAAGLLDANLGVQLAGTQLTSFSGTAGLREVVVQIPQLPKPLTRTNGTLLFQGTQIHLDNVSSFYDQVPAVAAGTFDTKAGFNIKVATAPVTLKAILQTFNVKQLPIAAIGEVQANLQLTGTPQKPVVTGSAVNTKLTRIDKLNIKALSTNFELVGSTLTIKNFQAQPSVGGHVDGSGEARLGTNGSVAIGFQAQDLPGDAIAGIYGATNLPIRVGRLSGQGRVEGTLGNIETVVHWNAPNATYPATGEVAISPNGTASLRNTNIQVAGGTVTGTGQLYPKEGTLQASFQAAGVQGQGLTPLLKRQLPPQLQGPISGIVNVAGNIHSLTPETIHATGSAAVSVAGGTVRANNINLNAGHFTAGVTLAGVQLGQLIPQGSLKLEAPINGAFNVAGNLVKNNEQSAIAAKASGQLNLGGGTVTVSSLNLDQDRFRAAVQANDVNVGSLSPQVPPPLRGRLNGNFDLAGNLNNLQLAAIQGGGSGSLRVDGGTITANNVNLASGDFSADLRANNLQVANLTPQLPPQLRGRLNGTFNVKGSLETGNGAPPLLATIQGSGSGSLDVGGGTVKASQVNVQAGRFNAAVQASDVQVSRLAPQLPPGLRGSRLNGNLYLEGNLDNPQLAAIQGSGSGILSNVGGGRVTASNIDLNAGRFSASVEASGVQVGSLAPQAPPTVRRGSLNGIFEVAGRLNNLQLNAIQARGSGSLNNLAGGTLAASNISLNAGRFEAGVRLDKVALSPFSSQLRGNVTGDLNLSGTLTALTPSDIRADGNLNFSQGVSSIEKPLMTAFRWDGQNLQIQQASAPGLEANGVVSFARVNSLVVPPITSFNLNATAQDLNLQKLPITLPNVQLAGLLDFNGNLSGTPSAPTVIGNNVRLRNLIVNGLAFDPDLTGSVRLQAGKGGNIQLRGIQDRIELAVAPNNQPTSFLVNVGLRSVNAANTQGQQPAPRIVANGRKQGDQLLVDVQSLPLGPLQKLAPSNLLAKLPPTISAQPVAGNLSGNFVFTFGEGGVFTLPSSITANNIAIANPVLGNIKGDQVTVGAFSLTEGNLKISNAEFQQGSTKYALSGSLNPTPGNFQAQVKVAQGNIQDILAAASIYDIQDLTRGFGQAPAYGTASDVRVQAVGNPQESLLLQLRRLAEIKAYQDRLRVAQEASPIPELRDLAGTLSGEVNIAGSLKQGFAPDFNTLNVNFDFNGANWSWGNRYTANRVIARGTLQNGILTLLPLQFDSGNTIVAFTGNVGGEQQTGQLRVRNLPVDQLQQIFNLPINITGSLNADANLAGSIKNPLARGEATLSNGLLNDAPVQLAQASFNYANARLNFGSNVLVAARQEGVGNTSSSSPSPTPNPQPPATQPINVVGNIPYKLPFAERLPDSNDIALTLSMQDQGFALLGALTRGQVAWVNGTGQVQVDVTGSIDPKTNTIQRLKARGMANIANATVKPQVLPDPLTGVTGKAVFGLNGIRVDSFQAKYGNGLITASGGLPISNSDIKAKNPLQVNIGDLAVNLKGLYSGGVKGNVQVTGTALAPKLGGEVQLSNGTVQIPAERIVSATTGGSGSSGSSNTLGSNSIEFNNLDLILGKGIQVTLSPLFNFLADGQLIVNGTLDSIQPAGTVSLRRGQVNLFTTQFRLDRGYPQTATFVPEQGLIPNLDVRLTAAVVESSGSTRLPIGTDTGNSSDRTYNDEVALRNLFAPLGEVRQDIPGLYSDRVGTVRIKARVLGAANQLSQTLQLTSTPPRSESEIVALLGGGFVQTLGSGDSTLGLANFAGSALLGNVQNVIGDALGLSEFRLFPYLDPNPKNRSSSTLDLAAEVGFDLNRRLSATVLKVLTANTQSSAQLGLLYRVNDKIILRGSTDLSSDNRAEVEYQTRF